MTATVQQTAIDTSGHEALHPTDYRKAVSLFATGIAVVTTQGRNGDVHGATVNSFTSLSMQPPTVMVSLLPGLAHSLISDTGWYGVSVLSTAQRVHSSHYGGRYEIGWEPDFVAGRYIPTLKGSLARFECQVVDTHEVHDHTLFIAHVIACEFVTAEPSNERSPLMFFSSTDSYVLKGKA